MPLARDKKLYLKAVKAYHADKGESIMTDAAFDALEDRIKAQDPDWGPLHQTGVHDASKEDVTLPNFMPSLTKHYPDQVDAWLAKKERVGGKTQTVVVSDKLDGSSVQIGYSAGKPAFMATRGDGVTGGNISFLLPFMDIPKTIPVSGDIFFRCEALMKEKTFRTKYSVKALGEKDGYKTARAAVAGILNRTGAEINASYLRDIDLVVLGVYGMTMVEGFLKAHRWGFKTAAHCETALGTLNATWLDHHLTNALRASVYAMDGLVIARNRRFEYDDSEKPKWATAFKRNVAVADAPQTTIRRIQWDVSHAGKWTPTAQFDPIEMDGVTVSQASLYSAEWMRDRKLGPGAVVKVIRSGEVIPKVIDVVKPAVEMQWPEGTYEWRGSHLYALEEAAQQRHRRIYRFLELLGVEELALKGIATMHDNGVNRIHKLLRLLIGSEAEAVAALTKAGIGQAKAKKLYAQRQKMLNASMLDYVLASSCFEQFGRSRFEALEAAGITLDDILEDEPDFPALRQRVCAVPGFGETTADTLVEGLRRWNKFWPTISGLVTVAKPQPVKLSSTKWNGLVGVWTGYRNKDEEALFIANGGKVANSVTKATTHLFCKAGASGSKIDKARAQGTNIVQWAAFAGA